MALDKRLMILVIKPSYLLKKVDKKICVKVYPGLAIDKCFRKIILLGSLPLRPLLVRRDFKIRCDLLFFAFLVCISMVIDTMVPNRYFVL